MTTTRDREFFAQRSDLESRLAGYGVTAAALLAAAAPSTAAPIHTVVNAPIPMGGAYNLDLNNDGATDFVLSNLDTLSPPAMTLLATGQGTNAIVGVKPGSLSGGTFGVGIPKKAASYRVGPSFAANYPSKFITNAVIGIGYPNSVFPTVALPFTLRFNIGPETHFGWLRASVALVGPNQMDALLVDYAYESDPDTDIHLPGAAVPEPGTLGMLAVGAAGLALLRRKRAAR